MVSRPPSTRKPSTPSFVPPPASLKLDRTLVQLQALAASPDNLSGSELDSIRGVLLYLDTNEVDDDDVGMALELNIALGDIYEKKREFLGRGIRKMMQERLGLKSEEDNPQS